MRILFCYVLRSFAMPALMCFLGLCALMLLFMSFDLIGACFDPKSKISLLVALDFLGGTLSMYLEWLLPAVFLLATLYTMWQFCRHSELIAMRAGGIGLGTVVAPIVLVATLAATLSYLNTQYYKPVAAPRAMLIKDSDFQKTGREPFTGGYKSADTLRAWTIRKMDIAEPNILRDVEILAYDEKLEEGIRRFPARKYIAPIAQWDELAECWYLQSDGGVSVTEIIYDSKALQPEREMARNTCEFMLFPETDSVRLIWLQNMRAETASASDRKILSEERRLHGLEQGKAKLRSSYDRYNQYATPLAIILVTLFAIPAGIASGRQSVFKGILLAIGMFLSYYIVAALSMMIAVNDWFLPPHIAVAIPPLVYGGAALYLFWRVR
ncbi:MAG: LptF/LptG family permease [bacterium]|nr:LptF/LptG family permease [bacterium]